MTTVVFGVQAKSPAPLFGVVGGTAVSSCRPVAGLPGQERAGFSGLSGADMRGYAGVRLAQHVVAEPVLPVLAERVLAECVLAVVAQDKQVQAERREVLLARVSGSGLNGTGFNGTNDGIFGDNGSTDGNTDGNTDGGNGSQPMSPWGYRTSSPPG
jgi:hypothetical protein